MGYKIGIDVGGTFTDLAIVSDEGKFYLGKTPTTPKNQAEGILTGLRKAAQFYDISLRDLLSQTEALVHGTTVATNAMLEYEGACTGIITTKGFRDELEIRRGIKESVFNLKLEPPYPIVPRRRRLTVEERSDYTGKVITPLNEEEARQRIRELKAMGVTAVAVCFLHSYANPAHEERVLELFKEEYPEAYVSISSAVLRQVREFERLSTTVVSAFVGSRLISYLIDLEEQLRGNGFAGQLMIMQSNGGIMTTNYLAQRAACALLSGPAAGVTAAVHLGSLTGFEDLITVDMGGTSYDACLIKGRQPSLKTDAWLARYRVGLPMIDIHSIGAGGGSIAWVDPAGALKVGPRSAGADPGPACYGLGGREPTVTDADLVLGYVNPDYFCGGEIKLDRSLAEAALEDKIAGPLGMSITEAALSVFQIVNANMANGIRTISVQRGHDPREFSLVAFGGAGAVHAGVQAVDLCIPQIIIPKWAGGFCAVGDCMSDMKVTEVQTFFCQADLVDLEKLNAVLQGMIERAERQLPEQGVISMEINRFADFRYHGEVHEVSAPIRGRARKISDHNFRSTVSDFHQIHEQLFGYRDAASPVDIVNLRVEVVGITSKPKFPDAPYSGEDASAALKGTRPAYFEQAGDYVETRIYDGSKLKHGNIIAGPCVVEEPQTTIVVYPNQELMVDRYLNYLVEVLL